MVEKIIIMQGNLKSRGMTLVELLTVIFILATLFAIVGPEVYKAIQADTIIQAAAKTLIADLKTAQNEAVRSGSGEMSTGGVLIRKSVFVAFTPGLSSYQVYSFADLDGNNKRENGGANDEVKSVYAAKTLPIAVKFGSSAAVTTTACKNDTGAPPANGMLFADFATSIPCDGGKQCIEFDGNGFPVGSSPTGGWNIYLTNNNTDNKNTYAVNINPAGNFTICKWPKGATSWTIIR